MGTIKIKVNDYYGNPSYYSVMPQDIFDALEFASLNEKEYTNVDKEQFDNMIDAYKIKMDKYE